MATKSDPEMKPCPFCGTHPDDVQHPASMIELPALQLECGKCGAAWPKVYHEDMETKFPDEQAVAEYWNRRALEQDGGVDV